MKPDNWPPCYPIARNDIEEDFPEGRHRDLVTFGYRIMLSNTFMLFWNFVCACSYADGKPNNSDGFGHVGTSIAFMIFGIPVTNHPYFLPLSCLLSKFIAFNLAFDLAAGRVATNLYAVFSSLFVSPLH